MWLDNVQKPSKSKMNWQLNLAQHKLKKTGMNNMDIEQIYLPTEHVANIKVDGIADFDGAIQLDTKITLSGDIEINGIHYNDFINDLRALLQKYQK